MKRTASKRVATKEPHIRKRPKKAEAPPISTYAKLKINDMDLFVGDSVAVAEYSEKDCYARINTIFKDRTTGDAMVSITWYYSPSDLYSEAHDFFG